MLVVVFLLQRHIVRGLTMGAVKGSSDWHGAQVAPGAAGGSRGTDAAPPTTRPNARAILRDYRSVGDPLWKRFKGGRDGTLRYYEGLVRVFTRRASRSPVVQELERVVAELARLAGAPGHE